MDKNAVNNRIDLLISRVEELETQMRFLKAILQEKHILIKPSSSDLSKYYPKM